MVVLRLTALPPTVVTIAKPMVNARTVKSPVLLEPITLFPPVELDLTKMEELLPDKSIVKLLDVFASILVTMGLLTPTVLEPKELTAWPLVCA